ncbi:MAG: hypothetical protein C4333_13585 [Meiothermus sp.]
MLQAVDDLQTSAFSLADEAESLMGDLSSQAATAERSLTLVQDSDGIILIASLKSQPTSTLFGQPLNIVIRCRERNSKCGPVRVWQPVPLDERRLLWYVAPTENGSRSREEVVMVMDQAPTTTPAAKPIWSYNSLGQGGFWADAMYCRPCDVTADPVSIHLRYPLPSIPGQELPRSLDLSPLSLVIREQLSLPRPFDLEDPPGVLLRDDLGLVLFLYKNPALREARSIEDLVGKPLGLLYLQVPAGSKLSKTDVARFMNVELQGREPDYTLVLTNLKDPNDVLRLPVRQAEWCDGCFGQDPPPRYLGIEDRLNDAPVVNLQVGPLVLRGIEVKNIRR